MTLHGLAAPSESHRTSEELSHTYKEFPMTFHLFCVVVFYYCGLLGMGIILVHFKP